MSANVIHSLLTISRNGQSGVLQVEADGVCTMIYVLKGVPVFAEEGTLGETLGRLLLRDGQITQDQYARILEEMTGSVIGAEQMRFGEVAIALGFLTPEQVNAALADQVRRKVERCIECDLGHCSFRDAPDELEGIGRYPVPVEPLVMQAVRTGFDEARVAMMLEGVASSYPELIVPTDKVVERFGMDPSETAFLGEIDGTKMVFQLIYQSTIGSRRASQVIAVLVAAEAVFMHDEPMRAPEPEPAPMPEWQQPQPLLQPAAVPAPSAPSKPASDTAPRAAAPSSPAIGGTSQRARPAPGPRPIDDAARRSMLLRLTRQIGRGSDPGESRPAASAPAAGPAPDPADEKAVEAPKAPPAAGRDSRVRAEQLFLSGKRHVKHERWRLAVPQLEQASRLLPEAAEYALYAHWARFQTLTDPTQMAALGQTMKKMALEAIQQDKHMAFAHHVLGQVQMMQGDDAAALKSFRVATKLDPDDQVGARFFRMLARKHGERVD